MLVVTTFLLVLLLRSYISLKRMTKGNCFVVPLRIIEDSLLLGGLAESDSAYCDRRYHTVVCPSVSMSICMSATLVYPSKAVRRNEMPFGRDTCGPK